MHAGDLSPHVNGIAQWFQFLSIYEFIKFISLARDIRKYLQPYIKYEKLS